MERDDLRQDAFIKVQRNIERMEAENATSACAWLKKILKRLNIDAYRKIPRGMLSLDAATHVDGTPLLKTLAAEDKSEREPIDSGELDAHRNAMQDMLRGFIEASGTRRSAVNTAYRNAIIAFRVVVEGASAEEIRESMEGVDKKTKVNTIQQWASRGRTGVMIPALEWWMLQLKPESSLHHYAEVLLGLMSKKARSDAGRARPERRKDLLEAPPVSDAEHCSSDQYEDDEADDA